MTVPMFVTSESPPAHIPARQEQQPTDLSLASASLPPLPIEQAPPSLTTLTVRSLDESANISQSRVEELTKEIERRATDNQDREGLREKASHIVSEAWTWCLKATLSCQVACYTYKALNPPVKGPYFLYGDPTVNAIDWASMNLWFLGSLTVAFSQLILRNWQNRIDSEWERIASLIDVEKKLTRELHAKGDATSATLSSGSN